MVKSKKKFVNSEAKLPMKRSKRLPSSKDLGALAKNLIYTIHGQRVILDADVAQYYGRPTSSVNQQRSRNQSQFPDNYAFQLTQDEWNQLKSQNVISKTHGGRRKLPWAYTEHGFAMLSTRLRGERATSISRIIIDTFVSYRRGTLPLERTLVGPSAANHRARLQNAIYKQMETLLT
jgi:hypothetical protein